MQWCLRMISWKYSFQKINEEYTLAVKKKNALDKLLEAGKISQPTYEWFNKEITETLEEIEKHRRELGEKLNTKISELQQQVKTLEIFLVNLEIQRATGEVAGEIYEKQIESLTVGINAARQELNSLKEAADELTLKSEALLKEPLKPIEETSTSMIDESKPELGELKEEKEETLTQFQTEKEPETLLEPTLPTEENVEENIEFQTVSAEEENVEPSFSGNEEEEDITL